MKIVSKKFVVIVAPSHKESSTAAPTGGKIHTISLSLSHTHTHTHTPNGRVFFTQDWTWRRNGSQEKDDEQRKEGMKKVKTVMHRFKMPLHEHLPKL